MMQNAADPNTERYQKLVAINLTRADDQEWVDVNAASEDTTSLIKKISRFPAETDSLTEDFLTFVEEAMGGEYENILTAIRDHPNPEFPLAIVTRLIEITPVSRIRTLKGAIQLLPNDTLSDELVVLLLKKAPLTDSPQVSPIHKPSSSMPGFAWLSFVLGPSQAEAEAEAKSEDASPKLSVASRITSSDYLSWLDEILAKHRKGYTLAMFAARFAPMPIMRLVLQWETRQKTGQTLIQDPQQNNLLHYAVQNPDERVFNFFAEYQKGKLICMPNAWGATPAHIALKHQHLNRAKELIRINESVLVTAFPLNVDAPTPTLYLLDYLLACLPYTPETLSQAMDLLKTGAMCVPTPSKALSWAALEITDDATLRTNFDIQYRNQFWQIKAKLDEYKESCSESDLALVKGLIEFLDKNEQLPYPLAISIWLRDNKQALRAAQGSKNLLSALWYTSAEEFVNQTIHHCPLVRFYPATPKSVPDEPQTAAAPSLRCISV